MPITNKWILAALALALVACGDPSVAVPVADVATEAPAPALLAVPVPIVITDADGWETAVVPDPPEVTHASSPVPDGFPAKDQYETHDEACFEIVKKEVPRDKGWRGPILDWCNHRSYHASRFQMIESKVDPGTSIHGRDRPVAWMFYQRGVLRGRLDPERCAFHRIDRKIKHPPRCVRLRRNWPYSDVKLSDFRQRQWKEHPHDMERFGTRGPHDWPVAGAIGFIPGCWDPAQLDRRDVNITATVRGSLKICKKHGCVTKFDIKEHWGRGKRKKKK